MLALRMLALRMFLFRGIIVLLHRAIGPGVVLVVVNLPTRIVLLMINLRALLRRQLAAVGGAVVAHFAVDIRFAILKVAGLARSQLSGLYAIGDTIVLIRFARVDLAHSRVRRLAMIF